MKKTLIVLLAVMFAVGFMFAGNSAEATVVGTAHDFSATGANGWGGTSTQVCVYCHHPHQGGGAAGAELLWNMSSESLAAYATYGTGGGYITLNGVPADVDAATAPRSFLCLTCHDGVIAPASLFAEPMDSAVGDDSVPIAPVGQYNLGITLEDDHPVNIALNDDPAIASEAIVNGPYPIFGGKIQCATCHDVHDGTATVGTGVAFMRSLTWMDQSEICLVCHLDK